MASSVHLLDASMCKGKVSFNLASRSCFPGVQGTPCRYPFLHLAAERPCQQAGRAEAGWLEAIFGKVPVLAKRVQCWIKKVSVLVNLSWPAMTKWQRAFSSWSASRLGRRGKWNCMSEQWWWKCALLWSHRKPVPKRWSMALGGLRCSKWAYNPNAWPTLSSVLSSKKEILQPKNMKEHFCVVL